MSNQTKPFEDRSYTIFAVDFDGVLCENRWPKIGPALENNILMLKELKRLGNKLILWTCRSGLRLDHAVEWAREHGIEFDAVNENLIEAVVAFGGDTRKIFADYYIDDKAVLMNDDQNQMMISKPNEKRPFWSKSIEERIRDGEVDPAYFFEGGSR